ncbi:hypothetical protein [Roseateles sp.]|uniref:hypothetical protein n=1 Tax=Roseateles sp. TaxID=1971397 RepID=UPI003BA9D229
MRTQFALLLLTDGRPTMTHAEFARLRSKSPRTIQNEIYAKRNPVPFWKDGGDYMCSVADVATWLDGQRDIAISELPHLAVYSD